MGTDLILTIDLNRNTTRQEYEDIQHWRRDCRRIVNRELNRAYITISGINYSINL
jgi:hypothetical protein